MSDNHFEDEAFVALRSHDPAQSASDLASIRGQIETSAVHHHVVEKKRASWLMPVAAAAAACLFIGTGAGYQLATSRSDSGSDSSMSAIAPGLGAPATDMNSGMNGANRTGSPVAGASDKMMPGFYGARAFLTPDASISDSAGTAVGYLIDDSQVDRKATMNAVARALGLKHIVKTQDGGYSAGDTTGMKAYAYVGGTYDKTVSFYFGDNSKGPWNCPVAMGSTGSEVSSSSSQGVVTSDATAVPLPTDSPAATPIPVPTQPACTPVSGKQLSDSAAISIAQKLFSAIGLNNSDAKYSVADPAWFGQGADGKPLPFSHVVAQVMVNGLETGMSWTADIGPQGDIVNANGFVGGFTATAAYDIVGAKSATLRSQDIHWSQFGPTEQWDGGSGLIAYASDARSATGVSATQPDARLDGQGRPLLVESYEDITITSADPSLTTYYLADGRTALLPAYALHSGKRTWLQIAIADQYLVH